MYTILASYFFHMFAIVLFFLDLPFSLRLHVMHNELYLIAVFSQDRYVYIKQSRSIGKRRHGIWVADMTHFGIVDMS